MMIDPVSLLLAVAVVAVPVYLLWPGKRARQKKRTKLLRKLRQSRRYWGVSIREGKCPTAQRIAGKGFSIHNVPTLPISGCGSSCTCTYAGLSERRTRNRRSRMNRREQIRFGGDSAERRSLQDARKALQNKWLDPAN